MTRSMSVIVVGLLTIAMSSAALAAGKFRPAPGCKARWSEVAALEATLKGERKIPYDPQTNPLKHCRVTQPLVNDEIGRAHEPTSAIIVFDVTGSGRVVEQQLIGKKTPWAELAQKEVATWLFEPLIEDDVGITRVGVTVAVTVAFTRGLGSCSPAKSPVNANFEVFVCASRP